MGERTANVEPANIGEVLEQLAKTIHERSQASADESYTARLLQGPADKMLSKLSEEAVEVIMASKDADHDHVRYEAADLLYHLLVVLEDQGVKLDELAGELVARRH